MSLDLGSQSSFLHGLKDLVPAQSCLSVLPLREVAKQAMDWIPFTVQKRLMPESSDASLAKRPHLESRTETHPGGKKSAVVVYEPVLLMLGRRVTVGVSVPDVYQSTASPSSLSLVFSGWYAFPFLGSVEKHHF